MCEQQHCGPLTHTHTAHRQQKDILVAAGSETATKTASTATSAAATSAAATTATAATSRQSECI